MGRSVLPDKGYITIPTALLFNADIPDAVKVTWCQLRSLAWGRDETPEFSAAQFEALTGKRQSTLYEHMRLLRIGGALLWRQGSKSNFIVYGFMCNDAPSEPKAGGIFQKSGNLEKPNNDLYTQLDQSTTEDQAFSRNLESRKKKRAAPAPADTAPATVPPAVAVYREISQRYPKRSLYEMIDQAVGDAPDNLDLWRRVVTAYIASGWNPINLLGMLEYYKRREVPAPKAQPQHGHKITPQQPGVVPAVNKAVVAAINARNAARRSGGGGAVSVPAQPVTADQRPASDT